MYHQNIMSYPQTKAGRPRNQALDPAILENLLGNLRAIPALAILGSLLVEEERHPAGIPRRLAGPRAKRHMATRH
jgi:hypothetical protein